MASFNVVRCFFKSVLITGENSREAAARKPPHFKEPFD